jgi:hypothetical protein
MIIQSQYVEVQNRFYPCFVKNTLIFKAGTLGNFLKRSQKEVDDRYSLDFGSAMMYGPTVSAGNQDSGREFDKIAVIFDGQESVHDRVEGSELPEHHGLSGNVVVHRHQVHQLRVLFG